MALAKKKNRNYGCGVCGRVYRDRPGVGVACCGAVAAPLAPGEAAGCPRCGGEGKYGMDDGACDRCGGSGVVARGAPCRPRS